jgi:hypothetical protein
VEGEWEGDKGQGINQGGKEDKIKERKGQI